MKVLIVDGDWRFARQATTYLESRAHLVVHQTGAREALAQAEHWRPDLVILAAEMSDKGVMESFTKGQTRPAVLLTGRLDHYHLVWKAWQKGGDDVLIKPVMSSDELQMAITTAMENATAGQRGRQVRTSA